MARTQSKGNYRDSGKCITSETPIALTIAGSDSSGGAGIQADLKAFHGVGVYGLTAVTAIVAESAHEVRLIEPVSTTMLEAQLDVLFTTYPIAAVKTGMLSNEAQVRVIADRLKTWKSGLPNRQFVVDPIIQSSSGAPLIEPKARKFLEANLLPLADLITPNLPEAIALHGGANSDEYQLGTELTVRFGTSILLKGGHGSSEDAATDVLFTDHGTTEYVTDRIPGGHNLHGTGCTLSAAITGFIARGLALEDAVAEAKAFMSKAISQTYHLGGGIAALGPSS